MSVQHDVCRQQSVRCVHEPGFVSFSSASFAYTVFIGTVVKELTSSNAPDRS